MRAQLSLEFLLIFAAILSFLLIWVSTADNLYFKINNAVNNKKANYLVQEINNSINEINRLRGKNIRLIEKLNGAQLISKNNELYLFYNGKNYSFGNNAKIITKNSNFYEIYYSDGVVISD